MLRAFFLSLASAFGQANEDRCSLRSCSIFICLAVLIAASSAHARALQGVVRERGTRAAVPGAVLYVVGDEDEAISDENGEYRLNLDGIRRSVVTLIVEAPGYDDFTENLNTHDDETVKLDVFLTPNADDTGSTTVRGSRVSRANRARGAHFIGGRAVNEMAGTYGDPAKAIENFPGMGRVRRSQGSLFVRGGSPQDTGVYVDGFEIPDLYHFTGSTSVINIPFVESVELVPGAFSARFGRATAGLVNIKTRKLPTDDVHGFAKLDVIDGGAYVGVPLAKNAAFGISARRSYLDVFAARDNRTDITLIPTYWDYQAKLDWDVTDGHELVVFAFGSGDRELYERDDTEISAPYRETKESDFHRLSLRYRNILGGGFSNEINSVLGFERRTTDEQFGRFFKDATAVDLQVREELVWRGDDERITVGVDATARVDTVIFRGLAVSPLERQLPQVFVEDDGTVAERRGDVEHLTLGLYAEGTFTPIPGLTLTPGLRLQSYGYERDPTLSIEPRFASQVDIFTGPYALALRGGAGVFSRAPNAEQIFAARTFGVELQTQNALHLQAGFDQGLGDLGRLSVNFFSIWRDHILTTTPRFPAAEPDDPLGSPVRADGAGFSYGTEFLLRLHTTKRRFAWISYAIARHEVRDGNVPGRVNYAYPSDFDTSHLLTVVGQTELGAGFRLGARYRLVSGMPETLLQRGTFDGDSAAFLPNPAGRNLNRFDVFQVLDVRVDWSWLLPWCELVLYADLVNVFNLRPREDTEYQFDFAASEPINGLPIIPVLGAKVTF